MIRLHLPIENLTPLVVFTLGLRSRLRFLFTGVITLERS